MDKISSVKTDVKYDHRYSKIEERDRKEMEKVKKDFSNKDIIVSKLKQQLKEKMHGYVSHEEAEMKKSEITNIMELGPDIIGDYYYVALFQEVKWILWTDFVTRDLEKGLEDTERVKEEYDNRDEDSILHKWVDRDELEEMHNVLQAELDEKIREKDHKKWYDELIEEDGFPVKVRVGNKFLPVGEMRLADEVKYAYPILCPVCGEFAFAEYENYDVCPFCGWENNDFQWAYPYDDCGPNYTGIVKARINYKKFGSKDKKSLPLVKALRAQMAKGYVPHNGTMYMHIQDFVKDADPVKMIEKM